MRRTATLTLLLIPVAVMTAAPFLAARPQSSVVKVKICNFSGASMTDAEADQILARCTMIMRRNDCPVVFQRDGSVEIGKGEAIYKPNQLMRFQSDYPHCNVRIFSNIELCGYMRGSFNGCSDPGVLRMSINVVRDDFEAQNWLHEFGHNCGLPDIPATNPDPSKIMNWQLGPNTTGLLPGQCAAFEATAQGRGVRVAAVRAGRGDQKEARSREPVEEFVRSGFPHSVPFVMASRYGPEDADKLIRMLDNPDQRKFFPHIVTTLCYIGHPKAVRPLIEFFRRGEGRLSPREFDAKNDVLLHMGDLTNLSGVSKEGVAFLRESLTDTGLWNLRVPWTAPFEDEGNKVRDEMLVASAIEGLGLSGAPEARDKLNNIKANTVSEETRVGVVRAIELNSVIAQSGVRQYRLQQERPKRE